MQVIVIAAMLLIIQSVNAQDSSFVIKTKNVRNYAKEISRKSSLLQGKLNQKESRAIKSFERAELKIARKLSKKDSAAAATLAKDIKNKYESIINAKETSRTPKYIPELDTMSTSLAFFGSFNRDAKENHLDADGVKKLQDAFSSSENIESFLKSRKEELKRILEQQHLTSQLTKLNKQVYYYSKQMQEYKGLLKDKKRVEKKVLQLISKNKSFQEFMRKNSQLATLFRMPSEDNNSSMASLAGLQTRAQVSSMIQQRLSSGGPNAQQQFQQSMQAAQGQLSQLKDKVAKFGGSSSDEAMPEGFKPNSQKTKSFWKRMELGTNIQSQRGNGLFPTTSDIALSLGYKLNDKSIIGIGSSYKLGLGHGVQNFKISHQGIGLRSFVDWKLKGSFWISGGFEMNYRAEIRSFSQLQNYSAWQQSGLIGVSKKLPIATKFFKNTKLMVLWDFLSYKQVPVAQPVVFRVGYSLR